MNDKTQSVLESIEYEIIGRFKGKIEKNFTPHIHEKLGDLSRSDAVVEKKTSCVDPYGLVSKRSQSNVIQPKMRIALVTSAWQTQDYIQQLLDSVENNSMHPNVVLIGVDGCHTTARALVKILASKKYPFSTKVFSSEENVGTYSIRNNLIDAAFNDHQVDAVICIDSDDMMHSEYVRCVHDALEQRDECVIAPNLIFNFNHKTGRKHSIMSYSTGINSFTRGAWKKVGYFLPFRAAADNEWISRCFKLNVNVLASNSLVYYRRMHENQLTKNFKISNSNPERSKCYAIRDSGLIIHPKIKNVVLTLVVDQ